MASNSRPTVKDPLVESLIPRLLSQQNEKQVKDVQISESDLLQLVSKARQVFLSQNTFIELGAPVSVCGDTHGQFHDLLHLFQYVGSPDCTNYLFLGDYVDRGKNSVEVVALLFCFKIKYPQNFFLLRGNHECANINTHYGFQAEVKQRYNQKMWRSIQDTFNCLPLAALIEDQILCMHGGISPNLNNWDQIRNIRRPIDVTNVGIECDLLWADPSAETKEFAKNTRGVSYTFGESALKSFLTKMKISMIARAHQVVEDGYEFFSGRKLVTIFSAPNYCGEFDNNGAVMKVSSNLECSFIILRPLDPTKAITPSSIYGTVDFQSARPQHG